MTWLRTAEGFGGLLVAVDADLLLLRNVDHLAAACALVRLTPVDGAVT